ncbi:MAG: hypothetical protein OEW21_04345 [Betaproteobacteria bacterium]|nr:hypothetical protein [Betaproteobacteria bacterium]
MALGAEGAGENSPAMPAAAHVEDVEPCAWTVDPQPEGLVLDSLDWTRRGLYGRVCSMARWFDGFFGNERFDSQTARQAGGELSFAMERRQGFATHGRPSLRVRVPLPNLNKRLHFFADREDERATTTGPADVTRAGETAPVAGADQVSRVGLGYQKTPDKDSLLKLRSGVRVSGGLKPFAEAQYRQQFWQTDATQWRFSETFFWRRPDGFGETTLLDFEARLGAGTLFRWFNDATVSQITARVGWLTGGSLFFDLGEKRALQFQMAWSGDTGAPVRLATYGPRLTYRQSLGPPWLFGEAYVGRDHPQMSIDVPRISQDYVGVKVELQFGREHERPPPAATMPGSSQPAPPMPAAGADGSGAK